MNTTETIATGSGPVLHVGKRAGDKGVELKLRLDTPKPCLLHWGLKQPGQEAWRLPPQTARPAGTQAVGTALQTPFAQADGHGDIVIRLPASAGYASLDFVLFFPEERAWDNNRGRNYHIELPQPASASADLDRAIHQYLSGQKPLFERTFEVELQGRLTVLVTKEAGRFVIMLWSDLPGLVLHWGIARYSSCEWFAPPPALHPPGTVLCEGHTAQTPFTTQDGLSRLQLEIPEADAPLGLQFVLKQPEANRWLRHRGGNFFVPVRADYAQKAGLSSPEAGSGGQRDRAGGDEPQFLDADAPVQSLPRFARPGAGQRRRPGAGVCLAALLRLAPIDLATQLQHQAARVEPRPGPADAQAGPTLR